MKVIDLINSSKSTAFSFEILPPLKGNSIQKVYNVIDKLIEFDPKYINITSHHSEYIYTQRDTTPACFGPFATILKLLFVIVIAVQ